MKSYATDYIWHRELVKKKNKFKKDFYNMHQCKVKDENRFDYLNSRYRIAFTQFIFDETEQIHKEIDPNDFEIIIKICYSKHCTANCAYRKDARCDGTLDSLIQFEDHHGHIYSVIKNEPNLSNEDLATLCEIGLFKNKFKSCLSESYDEKNIYNPAIIDEDKLNQLYYNANVWNTLDNDEFYNIKHFLVEITGFNEYTQKDIKIGEFFCRLYDVANSEIDACTLLDVDHGDSIYTANIIAKEFELNLNDESFIVYVENINIDNKYKNLNIDSHIISNISEIIYSLIFRKPSLVIMCAANESERDLIYCEEMYNDNIYIVEKEDSDNVYSILYSTKLNCLEE